VGIQILARPTLWCAVCS